MSIRYSPALALAAALAVAACATTDAASPPAQPVATAPTPAPMPAPTPAPPAASPATGGFDLARAKATFEDVCSSCHESNLASSRRHDRVGWERLVELMASYGMDATPEQTKEIVEYLVRTYPG